MTDQPMTPLEAADIVGPMLRHADLTPREIKAVAVLRAHVRATASATDDGDLAVQDRRASGSLAAAYRRGYRDAWPDVAVAPVIVVPDDLAAPSVATPPQEGEPCICDPADDGSRVVHRDYCRFAETASSDPADDPWALRAAPLAEGEAGAAAVAGVVAAVVQQRAARGRGRR